MKSLPLLVAATALALAGCSKSGDQAAQAPASGPVAAVPAPAGKSWAEVVTQTPEGGMRMGNPNAAVKLVEYASFSCPHCMRFAAESAEGLRNTYVNSGKVSYEFRSFLLHGPDAPVTLLMNCRGPEAYFKLSEQLFATQEDWFYNKIVPVLQSQQKQLEGMSPVDQFKTFVNAGGLYGFFGARGLPRAKADACLSDQKAIDKLTADQQRAQDTDQVTGTPTFFINGQMQDNVAAWAQLEPRLKAAIG